MSKKPEDNLNSKSEITSSEKPKIYQAADLQNNRLMNRRQFLKTAGISAGLGGIAACDSGDRETELRCNREYANTAKGPMVHASMDNAPNFILTASGANLPAIWDPTNGTLIREFHGQIGAPDAAAISPDGTRIAVGTKKSLTLTWKSANDIRLRDYTQQSGTIHSIEFSSDSLQVLTAASDGTVDIWDYDSAINVRRYEGHLSAAVHRAHYHQNGSQVVSCAFGAAPHIWKTANGLLVKECTGYTVRADVLFHPDDMNMVSGEQSDNSVIIWDIGSLQEQRRYAEHTSIITAIAISPNGDLVASADQNGHIHIWDYATATKLFVNSEHKGSINSLYFSPNSQLILSSSDDYDVRLINTSNGQTNTKLVDQVQQIRVACIDPSNNDINCTCDIVCSCDSICSCDTVCSCDSQGSSSHYWYPN